MVYPICIVAIFATLAIVAARDLREGIRNRDALIRNCGIGALGLALWFIPCLMIDFCEKDTIMTAFRVAAIVSAPCLLLFLGEVTGICHAVRLRRAAR